MHEYESTLLASFHYVQPHTNGIISTETSSFEHPLPLCKECAQWTQAAHMNPLRFSKVAAPLLGGAAIVVCKILRAARRAKQDTEVSGTCASCWIRTGSLFCICSTDVCLLQGPARAAGAAMEAGESAPAEEEAVPGASHGKLQSNWQLARNMGNWATWGCLTGPGEVQLLRGGVRSLRRGSRVWCVDRARRPYAYGGFKWQSHSRTTRERRLLIPGVSGLHCVNNATSS